MLADIRSGGVDLEPVPAPQSRQRAVEAEFSQTPAPAVPQRQQRSLLRSGLEFSAWAIMIAAAAVILYRLLPGLF